jgi:hypothetical protein
MKVRVVVTDGGGGNTYEGEATLVVTGGARRPAKTAERKPPAAVAARTSLDFSLPVRAFMKRHAKGLGGAQKFTVLLARMSGGKTGASISRGELEKAWNRMTGLMGGRFNPSYTTRAKDNGWVDTPKMGYYALRSSWTGALGE